MKVGIIGAGTMGSGIAQAFAQVDGYEVCLCDINEEFASNGKLKISKNFEKRVAKGKMAKEDADKILARIHTGVKTICSDCDLVVEAAIENMEIFSACTIHFVHRLHFAVHTLACSQWSDDCPFSPV